MHHSSARRSFAVLFDKLSPIQRQSRPKYKSAVPNWFIRRTLHVPNLIIRFGTCKVRRLNRARLRVVPHFSSGIEEQAKRERAWKCLSPHRVSPILAWGDFHARSRFDRSTIPEEKWGTTRSLSFPLLPVNLTRFCDSRIPSLYQSVEIDQVVFNSWLVTKSCIEQLIETESLRIL